MGRMLVIAIVSLLLGVAAAAAAFAYIPDPGSPPSIYDDFNFSSAQNGFWHVNADGGTAKVKAGNLSLAGHAVELDRRLQTDPRVTVVSARVRGVHMERFAVGLGLYHSGTVGLELDNDGAKCGRGTDHGWRVDFVKGWAKAPLGQWFYLRIVVGNPYPGRTVIKESQKKSVSLTCSIYDGSRRLIGSLKASDPPPNTHYEGIDEAYLRTWDSGNLYNVDWFYAGPPSGDPLRTLGQK